MNRIVDFTTVKSPILPHTKKLKYINFGQPCTFVDGIASRSGEFAPFRGQARSNAPLFPMYGGAGLSTD